MIFVVSSTQFQFSVLVTSVAVIVSSCRQQYTNNYTTRGTFFLFRDIFSLASFRDIYIFFICSLKFSWLFKKLGKNKSSKWQTRWLCAYAANKSTLYFTFLIYVKAMHCLVYLFICLYNQGCLVSTGIFVFIYNKVILYFSCIF